MGSLLGRTASIKSLLSGLLMVISLQLAAQQPEIILKGFLGVEGGESYTYKLVFRDSSGYISGFAYTWLYEQKQVKASITGQIDRTNKTLSFKETNIISNTGFESNTTICLIQAQLKYNRDNETMVFSGAITSSDISNVYCGQGTITLTDDDALKSLFVETSVKPETKLSAAKGKSRQPVTIIYDTVIKRPDRNVSSYPPIDKEEKLTSGEEKMVKWETDSIKIKLWDGGEIDGDIVTLSINNIPILSKYKLEKQPKLLTIPANQTEIQVVITANNEGNTPPNTANLTLVDGSKEYPFLVYNTIGKQATIRFKKSRK
jgi:hypothetical protein